MKNNTILDLKLEKLEKTLDNIKNNEGSIMEIAKLIADKFDNEGRIIFIGAGMAPEMIKIIIDELWLNFQIRKDKFVSLTAARNFIEDTDTWKELEEVFSTSIFELDELGLQSNDLVIGLSASGKTQYVVSALKYSFDIGCETVLITDHENTQLEKYSKHILITGFGNPPIIGHNNGTGATVQKIMVDLILYNAMTIAGRIYEGHLVFMKPVSKKIKGYCIETIQSLLVVDEESAKTMLKEANDRLEVALIKGLKGIENEEAIELLKLHNNNFNKIFND